jgi:hypothetical protein
MTLYHGAAGLRMIVEGLYAEFHNHKGTPYAQYTVGQSDFLSKIVWSTDWAKEKASTVGSDFKILVSQCKLAMDRRLTVGLD